MPANLRPAIVMALAALLALSACAQGVGDTGRRESAVPSRPAPSPIPSAATPSASELAVGDVPDEILSAVVEDAARRTDVPEAEITVRQAEAVTWNDGSLGCPEPGTVYTQALVDGYHIVLDADGELLDYRVGSGSDIRLCESPIEGGG
jgi:hypothetical protein